MKRTAAEWLAMADWAERKANENGDSDKPWALKNVRLYQGKMLECLAKHYEAAKAEDGRA